MARRAGSGGGRGRPLGGAGARGGGRGVGWAGTVGAWSREYFEKGCRPDIGDLVTWHENVVGVEKAGLLAKARAMIFPIQWEEPFGMAMVEAMVSATPVVAMARGAASEIVEPGITGWLAEDIDGLVEAYGRIGEIDLELCVTQATERFGPQQLADGYQSVYETEIQESYHR